jgi:hypothetical protein
MAENLLASPQQQDSTYGEQSLEDMVRSRRSMEAAATLARRGSRAPFDILRRRFDAPRDNPSRVFTSRELYFLMQYGALEQWQMIHELAQAEIEWYGQLPDISDGPNRAGVLPVLVENSDRNSLWIAPCLALALDQVKLFHTDRFYASEAVEALQNLTGETFGFDRDSSVERRLEAVEKARNWWNRTGKTTYSFARVAALWQKMTPPEPSTSTTRERSPINEQVVPDGLYQFDWTLKVDQRATQSQENEASSGELTDIVVRVANNHVTCIKSSNPECVGAKGTITSEGQGRFVFRLPIPGYEELSHRWIINIDETFTVEDRDGTTRVKPLSAK